MKAMISQPMNGYTNDEITNTRQLAKAHLESIGYEVVNTLFTEDWNSWCTKENMNQHEVVNTLLFFLARSIDAMSKCDAVYFCKGWNEARGCKIEHEIAKAYGVTIIYG